MNRTLPLLLATLAWTACDAGVDFPALDDPQVDPDTDADTDVDTDLADDGWDDTPDTSSYPWSEVLDAELVPFGGPPVIVLTDLATDGETLLAASGADAWISADGGASWERIALEVDGTVNVRAVNVTGDEILISESRGFHRSTDGGRSFERIPNQTEAGHLLLEAVGDGHGGLYAVQSGGINPYRWDGERWVALDMPSSSAALTPTPDGLYAAVPWVDELYTSDDGGETWSLVSSGGVGSIDHVDGALILGRGGSGSSLRRSDDGGETWTALGEVGFYDLFEYHDGVYYRMSRDTGLERSDDGLAWTPLDEGLPEDLVGAFDMVVADDGSITLSTFAPYGVWRRPPDGSFAQVSDGLEGGDPSGVVQHGELLVAAFGQQGLWAMDEGGWFQLDVPSETSSESYINVESAGDRLVVSTSRLGMLTSTDGGETWTDDGGRLPTWNGSAGKQRVSHPDLSTRGDWIFAATSLPYEGATKGEKTPIAGGASLFSDRGMWEWATWGMPQLGVNNWGNPYYAAGTAIEAQPDRVLLGTAGHGVYVSEDRGENWETSTGIPAEVRVTGLAATSDGWIATGSATEAELAGAWRSTDGGYSWSPVSEGLPEGAIDDVIAADDTAFALVSGHTGGLYRLDGDRWSLVAAPTGRVALAPPLYQQDDLFVIGTLSHGLVQVQP